ncbi:threonine-phosphate decarboxylase CobD [Cognatishimia sp. F0-27]|uniref:threonine-phosphate decarboxylase CobD n=1 Tax=Cognatishimia sp. F0-27 TaxID=2816855 RepID=UPI001D0CCFE4|nr:threonine-phosphate decarboxylase CobD [Cognatishimia sp. F0-27]MCC1493285.1 threonine-phosphate decarboxylase [Cognatishimia sp. F0-27]
MEKDHGGNLDEAMQRYGGTAADWLDLSTGINPQPYPVPEIPQSAWADLPTRTAMAGLIDAARRAYRTKAAIVATHGAQGAIQMVPFLRPATGRAVVLGPTYNEHAACLRMAGWPVDEVAQPDACAGAEIAVIVTPNNPDGRLYTADALRRLAATVGLLVVDESFMDPTEPHSLAPLLGDALPNVVVLRSFGKFYGLAGVRLGFALARPALADRLAGLAGPWPVSGPAIAIAQHALADGDWQRATIARLERDSARLDALAEACGWRLVGGTTLFRTYDTPDAAAAQDALAHGRVWSRIFPYSTSWIRLGMPPSDRWPQLVDAMSAR